MVAPSTDLRDWDAENLMYVVLSGFITRPASLLISARKSWKAPCNYQNIIDVSTDLRQSVHKQSADKPSPCLIPLLMTKELLIFPSTITLSWAPSSVIFTSLSIFLGIPKLTSDSSSFFWFMLSKDFSF